MCNMSRTTEDEISRAEAVGAGSQQVVVSKAGDCTSSPLHLSKRVNMRTALVALLVALVASASAHVSCDFWDVFACEECSGTAGARGGRRCVAVAVAFPA
jgi:hypothetical protein